MKHSLKTTLFLFVATLFLFSMAFAQKVETIDGIRVIHNGDEGLWGKNPEVSLEFVRMIGEMESENEALIFYMPSDIAFDSEGNVYVMDTGNHRVQKFKPDGTYSSTLGRQGQGPGEFQYPQSLAIDAQGNMYIADMGSRKIHVLKPDGTELRTIQMEEEGAGSLRLDGTGRLVMSQGGGFMLIGPGGMNEDQELGKLLAVLDDEGKIIQEFGEKLDYKDFLTNNMGNRIHFALDQEGYAYVAFDYQNRIDKYSPRGEILWRAERELDFDVTAPKKKAGRRDMGEGRVEIRMPEMNRCATGIAVDGKGRVWVASLNRQLEEGEQVQTEIRMTMDGGGRRSMNLTPKGNTDVRKTDAFRLEVYSSDGELLGKLQLEHFVDDLFIIGNKIYVLDKMRGSQYYEYNIVEK